VSHRDEPLDLSARSRRGELTDDEQKRLRSALGASATLSVAHRTGMDFDAALGVQSNDSTLIDGIVAGALRRTKVAPTKGRRRWGATWLVAAAVSLCTAGALGWWGTARNAGQQTPVASSSADGAAPPKRVEGALPPEARVQSRPDPPAIVAQAPAASPREPLPSRAVPSALGPPRPTASELLGAANEARSSGRATEAVQRYRELQAAFPKSVEAQTSRLALGRLLLERGEPGAALAELERYPRSGAALSEEAQLWRARALRQLGRVDDERAAWTLLLRQFPHSAYEAEARGRLASPL
jgi:TolA-binding protein